MKIRHFENRHIRNTLYFREKINAELTSLKDKKLKDNFLNVIQPKGAHYDQYVDLIDGVLWDKAGFLAKFLL